VTLPLRVERRGLQRLPRLTIHTSWPLGLLRAWAFVETDQQLLVYPRPGPPAPPREAADYRPDARGDKGVGADDFVAKARISSIEQYEKLWKEAKLDPPLDR